MKPVALICAAVAVAIAHSARSPNIYEAVIEEQQKEREASREKERESKHELDQMLANEKNVHNGIAAVSKSSKTSTASKPLERDAPMPAAWQEMNGLVAALENDAKKGIMDVSVQAAAKVEKNQAAISQERNTGMEYKVFDAETTLGESENKRRYADPAALPPIAAGQSWGAIEAEEDISAKKIMDPSARVQIWENAMSNDLKDVAHSVEQEKKERHKENAVVAANKIGEVLAKGEQKLPVKKVPALLENAPKKKKLVAVDKNVHVNNGGNDVWPNVMPSMQVWKEEPVKVAPAKKVSSVSAGSAASKALHAEALRALNEFHSDPMYQHLLGPSEDPELSAQTQQDLRLLHNALSGSKKLVSSSTNPVVTKPTMAKPMAAKSAAAKPAIAKEIPKPHPQPLAYERIASVPHPLAVAAPQPVSNKQVAPRPQAHPVPQPILAKPTATKRGAAEAQHGKLVTPMHVAQKRPIPKLAAPKPLLATHSPVPSQMPRLQPVAQKRTMPALKAAFRRPSPMQVPVKTAEQPKSRGAKLWSADMQPGNQKISREDSLEARVAEQAAETRAEMEKELSAPDEEFPVAVNFAHATSTRKLGVPEGYGTKTMPIEGIPSQGVEGKDVAHEDGKSMTKDWGTEYGMVHKIEAEQQASPPQVKGGAAAWTTPWFAVALFFLT